MKTSSQIIIISVVGLAVFTAPVAANADCLPAPTGLVAWWRAEGNALDSIGGNHGILTNGTTFTSGLVGQAFQFDGTNGLVDLDGNTPFRRSDAITYVFWARLPSGGGGNAMGVGCDAGQGYGGVYLDPANFYFTWTPSSPDSDAYLAAVGFSFPSNQWMHFAVTVDYPNQEAALYTNGTAVSTTLANLFHQPIINWLPNSLYNAGWRDSIGGRFINIPFYFKGDLDEVDVYSRALNANEIAALFAAGSAGKCVQTPGAPTLFIVPAGAGQATLSWSPGPPGFVLQETLSLAPTNWVNSASGATNPITVPAALPKKFYRLIKP